MAANIIQRIDGNDGVMVCVYSYGGYDEGEPWHVATAAYVDSKPMGRTTYLGQHSSQSAANSAVKALANVIRASMGVTVRPDATLVP